jgi:hypothetical protein
MLINHLMCRGQELCTYNLTPHVLVEWRFINWTQRKLFIFLHFETRPTVTMPTALISLLTTAFSTTKVIFRGMVACSWTVKGVKGSSVAYFWCLCQFHWRSWRKPRTASVIQSISGSVEYKIRMGSSAGFKRSVFWNCLRDTVYNSDPERWN